MKKSIMISWFLVLVLILSSVFPIESFKYQSSGSIERIKQTIPVILKEQNKQRINFITMGNSVGSGYTVAGGKAIPLLDRNEEFNNLLKDVDSVKYYKFARSQDTTNIRQLKLIMENRRLNLMNKDAVNGIEELDKRFGKKEKLTTDDIEKYYGDNELNPGIKDILSDDNSINIIILNCNVGLMISKMDRGLNLSQKLFAGFAMNKDLRDLQSLLQTISLLGKNNYVFLTGINNVRVASVLNIWVSLTNLHIKNICNNFLNVEYVDPIATSGIYFNPFVIDIHPDKEEYLRLTEKYFKSISDTIHEKIILNDIYNIFEKTGDKGNIYKYSSATVEIEAITKKEELKQKYSNSEIQFEKAMKEFHNYYKENYDNEFYRITENLLFDK